MSKKTEQVVEGNKVVENNETPSPEDVIQTLRVQLLEHKKQAEYHQTMSVKAQGALEVLLQLHPQQEEENNEN